MAVGRQMTGPLDDARQQRTLREREVLDVFVEVSARSFAKAVDAERAALSHGHQVGVHLKDALLGKLLLQFDRDQHLRELALHGLFRREEEATRELHGQSRAALPTM